MFPTLLELAQIELEHEVDGISMVPTLLGKKDQRKHDYLYWEFGERGGATAVLKGDWKGVRRNTRKNPDGPIELYNLKTTSPRQQILPRTKRRWLRNLMPSSSASMSPRNNFTWKTTVTVVDWPAWRYCPSV